MTRQVRLRLRGPATGPSVGCSLKTTRLQLEGLGLEVLLKPELAQLAPVARLLEAAEGRRAG